MQTKRGSFFEAACNVISGLITANLVWVFIIIPLSSVFNWGMTEERNGVIWIVNIIFTTVSMIRSYCWRRLFNWLEIKGVVR